METYIIGITGASGSAYALALIDALLARGAIISEIVIIVLLSPVLCVCESFIAKTTPSWRLKT